MLVAVKDARAAYEKISNYEDVMMGREAKVKRLTRQLEKLWPKEPERLRKAPRTKRKSSGSGGVSLPPTQTVTPAAAEPEAGTLPPPAPGSQAEAYWNRLEEVEAESARQPPDPAPHGRRQGEYLNTQRVVAWLHTSGHRLRWLAKQLDVSKAHMNNCLLGFSKLSHGRARKLDALMAGGEGGSVS